MYIIKYLREFFTKELVTTKQFEFEFEIVNYLASNRGTMVSIIILSTILLLFII